MVVVAVQSQTAASAAPSTISNGIDKETHTKAQETTPYNADGGVTSQLCGWIAGLQLDDIPEAVRTRAKYLVLDGLACALVGARVPWSQKAFDAMRAFEAPGKHVVIGYEEVCYPRFPHPEHSLTP